ncbi:DNA alkylation repair protein [Hydrogenophaga sp.]|uniref:DNA alkylation repair protein n=1 Tax=Hydrogenophaga sp. TaxID=1904254 RepID=UPI00271610C4|nr:DNA alkylation repair protein [Hydrogenophaga sp.]MDO8903204.1 DNA alkylation repair protein [Hydrogenophaga sp.]
MAEAFKNLIHPGTVSLAGEHLQRVWPAFDRRLFQSKARNGLEELEFKARAMQVADALEATLPADFDAACAVLEASLAPAMELDAAGEPVNLASGRGDAGRLGLSGWVLWSAGEFVARRGLDHVPRALACLHAITQRFTAELAIRPFLQHAPQVTLTTLAGWVHDPSAHVRRLVSEGSRPRLPWGLRLQALVQNPTPTLPLLRALQNDTSAYVRRSVANHLNDIAKDHPDLVAGWVVEHLRGASDDRIALLRHASRTLIKQGHAPTLSAWGLGQGLQGQARLALSKTLVAMGESIDLSVSLKTDASAAQSLVIDYAVHHVRANGTRSPKVFKGWKLSLAPDESRTLSKRHSLRPVTTRRLYPGLHQIDLLINGRACARAEFELLSDMPDS